MDRAWACGILNNSSQYHLFFLIILSTVFSVFSTQSGLGWNLDVALDLIVKVCCIVSCLIIVFAFVLTFFVYLEEAMYLDAIHALIF